MVPSLGYEELAGKRGEFESGASLPRGGDTGGVRLCGTEVILLLEDVDDREAGRLGTTVCCCCCCCCCCC